MDDDQFKDLVRKIDFVFYTLLFAIVLQIIVFLIVIRK
jgi:hypothetical protein